MINLSDADLLAINPAGSEEPGHPQATARADDAELFRHHLSQAEAALAAEQEGPLIVHASAEATLVALPSSLPLLDVDGDVFLEAESEHLTDALSKLGIAVPAQAQAPTSGAQPDPAADATGAGPGPAPKTDPKGRAIVDTSDVENIARYLLREAARVRAQPERYVAAGTKAPVEVPTGDAPLTRPAATVLPQAIQAKLGRPDLTKEFLAASFPIPPPELHVKETPTSSMSTRAAPAIDDATAPVSAPEPGRAERARLRLAEEARIGAPPTPPAPAEAPVTIHATGTVPLAKVTLARVKVVPSRAQIENIPAGGEPPALAGAVRTEAPLDPSPPAKRSPQPTPKAAAPAAAPPPDVAADDGDGWAPTRDVTIDEQDFLSAAAKGPPPPVGGPALPTLDEVVLEMSTPNAPVAFELAPEAVEPAAPRSARALAQQALHEAIVRFNHQQEELHWDRKLSIDLRSDDGMPIRLTIQPDGDGHHRVAFLVAHARLREELRRALPELRGAVAQFPIDVSDVSIESLTDSAAPQERAASKQELTHDESSKSG